MVKIENMTEDGGYIINVQPRLKSVYMNVRGRFTPELADQFHIDYQKQIGSISTFSYVLEIDCREIKTVNPQLNQKLACSFELFKRSGFKKIDFQLSEQSIIKPLIDETAKQVALPNYQLTIR
ncbi:hypothetical protein SH601_00285 [Gracilibacillus sp. S3-1-1]|uniref:Uncharacterized protein n=1 Tax=Gracilibacillus pellucidus TaxID=3095368 RepID=A0ACC6M0E7_9BACI|nr:hypothetical protein [Gracilibacillus sp. S3-1-1]MDX8044410.1 hypothetical protein [Gracilibacillus sp. S3-1-1]